ncbi:MAG: hypothetical protein CMM56_02505 [Rhodospirillaceae bacterium]|mgnify:CR=1 FL=1|nr:hypothetical protein [Rhodospirillaceae bacterium]
MPTYVYESIPLGDELPDRFELVQGMNDEPISSHPETGRPVRRVITGGLGVMGKPIRRSTVINKSLAAATPCGCSRDTLAQSVRPQHDKPRLTSAKVCNSHGSRPHRH